MTVMNDVNNEATEERESSAFDGIETQTFEVTKAVNLTQLTDEISEAANTEVMLALIGDYDAEPSEDKPQVLEVHPASVDGRTVRGKITSHVPQADYGQDADLTESMRKVLEDDEVTLDDLVRVVRSLVQST